MPTPLPVHGVDISHHQGGTLDLVGAKRRGLQWLYHKATEGTTVIDKNYNARRVSCARAGLPFGAYHFARPDIGDAAEEARFFLSVAKPRPGDLRPVLDLETTEGLNMAQIRTWAKEFCAIVKRVTGHAPIIYTPYDLMDVSRGHLLWRPRYNNDNRPPALPWDIWQFSNGVFGVPNTLAGIGHVDLNTMRKGLTLSQMLIPQPAPKKTTRLKVAHASLQFSDTRAQQTQDLMDLFSQGYDVITGTEAGHSTTDWNQREVGRIAALKGYLVSNPVAHDTWVAVKKVLVASEFKAGSIQVFGGSKTFTPPPPGKWGPKAVTWASWNMGPTYGRFAVASVHYLTRGGAGAALKQKTDLQYATAIGKWVNSLPPSTEALCNGDFNRNDQSDDVFLGKASFLSAADELREWDNTGHGPIDAICRERTSTRVKALSVEALDDADFFQHSDHFVLEVVYEVTAL